MEQIATALTEVVAIWLSQDKRERWRKTDWEALDHRTTVEKAEERVKFWESLNEIAVEGRGEAARKQFRIADANLGWN